MAAELVVVGKEVCQKAIQKALEKAAEETVKRLSRELMAKGAQKGFDKIVEASDSKSLDRFGRPVVMKASEALAAKDYASVGGGSLLGKGRNGGVALRGGPEDAVFNMRKDRVLGSCVAVGGAKFCKSIRFPNLGIKTPHGLMMTHDRREVCYCMDVKPSECFSADRKVPRRGLVDREIKSDVQKAIERFDECMKGRNRGWEDPDCVPSRFIGKMAFRLPAEDTIRVKELLRQLSDAGRQPEAAFRGGIACVKFNPKDSPVSSADIHVTPFWRKSPTDGLFVTKFRNSDGLTKYLPHEGGRWEGVEGNSMWKPDRSEVPTRYNKDEKTWGQILDENNIEGIVFKDGEPDFTPIAVDQVKVEKITADRSHNFAVARKEMADKWNSECRDGRTDWTGGEVQKFADEHDLTWHECGDGKTMQLVPSEVHNNISHSGGVSLARAEAAETAVGSEDAVSASSEVAETVSDAGRV